MTRYICSLSDKTSTSVSSNTCWKNLAKKSGLFLKHCKGVQYVNEYKHSILNGRKVKKWPENQEKKKGKLRFVKGKIAKN